MRTVCKAASEASSRGTIGRYIARASAENIALRLDDPDIVSAAESGVNQDDCDKLYHCVYSS